MANAEHIAILKQGVEAWNEWREQHLEVRPDFREANLSSVDVIGDRPSPALLREANLSGADLYGAFLLDTVLNRAVLERADVREAYLRRAVLRDANLGGATLSGANLEGADLSQADLREANFSLTYLSGADLSRARLFRTYFACTDLSGVKNLETARHEGPSSIGIDTFYYSQGKIPDVFLRGCGVPETFITYARSLAARVIEFYSCFISHSSQDQAFVERLHADLCAKSLRVWFAPEDLRIGVRFQRVIEESIRLYDKVMIVLSENSVASPWVLSEVEAARERERREKRTVLFPIRIDDAVMDASTPWAAEIRRTRHIGDFRSWNDHDAYTKAFDRLLRDLHQGETGAAAGKQESRPST